jgi:hypothetical protein
MKIYKFLKKGANSKNSPNYNQKLIIKQECLFLIGIKFFNEKKQRF